MAHEAVWRALSNPVRRKILDQLRDRPRTTGWLAQRFPDLSRFAVMQHLGVLEEARLVLPRRRGRERLNFLNAVPLQQIYERWVSRFAADAARKAVAFKKHVEGQGEERQMGTEAARAVRIENEIRLNAPIERVWAAMTTEQLEWYPHTYGRERVKRLVFESRVGGVVYEDWGEGRGKLYGVIDFYDAPKAYSMLGHLGGGVSLESRYTLEADGKETILKGSTVCFGEITEEMEEQIRFHGSLEGYEDSLRKFVEAA